MSRWKRTLLVTVLSASAMVIVGLMVLWERCGLRGCPDVGVLEGYARDSAAVVLDRHGVEVARLYRVQRVVVPLDSLPPHVPAAFVAVEDQRFWEHGGVDWRRVLGAALANLRAGGIREGFSTITMQLARNVFPDHLPYLERTIPRKIAEMRVAREIEQHYSKRQILEFYLNRIYFGSSAWGIEAAAHEYFGKKAAALTLAEAAVLAGAISAPHDLNPRANGKVAARRRSVVLDLMLSQGLITAREAAKAASSPVVTSETALEPVRRAPYFIEEVRSLMERELGEALYTEGYIIHTTLDAEVQPAVEAEMAARLSAVEAGVHGRYSHPIYDPAWKPGSDGSGTKYLQAAVVVLEAATGDVLAMVGGRDFTDSRFNRAKLAWRQPASAFKPFVYAAALARGYTPVHPLADSPLRLELGNGEVWSPRNNEGRYADTISLRDALVLSSNVATVRLAQELGMPGVVAFAERLGLDGPFPLVPSLALGTAEVTLLDLTASYTAFATLGRRSEPRLVLRVEDRRGRVVWRLTPRVQDVLEPDVAFLVTDILRDAVDRGTGKGVRAAGFRGPAAGKTGTTNRANDLWFVGYTPALVAGVWIGLDLPRPISERASAEDIAAPLWGAIMRRIPGSGRQTWRRPPGIEMRRADDSGRVYAADCGVDEAPRVEYFLAGTAPAGRCGLPDVSPGRAAPAAIGIEPDSVLVPAVAAEAER